MVDSPPRIYLIACGPDDGTPAAVGEVGFKAHNLMRIAHLGATVPPAFVLGTDWCRDYHAAGGRLPDGVGARLAAALRYVETASGLAFGSSRRPLLVSVRSGAPVSMPGMMETVLNVGLSDATVPGMLRISGNPRLVWDSYRRLVLAFAQIVAQCPAEPFEHAERTALTAAGAAHTGELDYRGHRALVQSLLGAYRDACGEAFPQSPVEQLERAVAAVLRSWDGAKARWYRAAHGLADTMGTAVVVQQMVFGNAGGTSGAGVGFTRNPASGAAELYLDYAPNAQGEDVVSGRLSLGDVPAAELLPPGMLDELRELEVLLEREFGDAQEFEFTVQDGRLYLLQSRDAKRTPLAALRIAIELAESGSIAPATALARIDALDPGQFLIETLSDPAAVPLAQGIAAGPGVAAGELALDPAAACARAATGVRVILVRDDVATEDIAAIEAAAALLTRRGARTSHAAVVARQLGKPCVVGCADLEIDGARLRAGSRWLLVGEQVTLDGTSGRFFADELALTRTEPVELLARLAALRQLAR